MSVWCTAAPTTVSKGNGATGVGVNGEEEDEAGDAGWLVVSAVVIVDVDDADDVLFMSDSERRTEGG